MGGRAAVRNKQSNSSAENRRYQPRFLHLSDAPPSPAHIQTNQPCGCHIFTPFLTNQQRRQGAEFWVWIAGGGGCRRTHLHFSKALQVKVRLANSNSSNILARTRDGTAVKTNGLELFIFFVERRVSRRADAAEAR